MKKFFTAQSIYKYSTQVGAYFAIGGIFFLAYGVLAGLFVAPMDYQHKDMVRIIYVHVPCAMLSLSIYTVIGILSAVYLIWKVKLADIIAEASAPFGAMVTFIALISGALWGKPSWGAWWVWDARLCSELILLFLYFGYIGLRGAITNTQQRAVVCAILAVVGLIDIPIIHFSVVWWNTLHQNASIARFAKPAIDLAMLYPLLSVTIAMYMFYISVVCIEARSHLLLREKNTKWVKILMEGKFISV